MVKIQFFGLCRADGPRNPYHCIQIRKIIYRYKRAFHTSNDSFRLYSDLGHIFTRAKCAEYTVDWAKSSSLSDKRQPIRSSRRICKGNQYESFICKEKLSAVETNRLHRAKRNKTYWALAD